MLQRLADVLARVTEFSGDLTDGPPFAKVEMSDRLNIDHLEHPLSSLTPKFLGVRSQGYGFGAQGGSFSVITPLSLGPYYVIRVPGSGANSIAWLLS